MRLFAVLAVVYALGAWTWPYIAENAEYYLSERTSVGCVSIAGNDREVLCGGNQVVPIDSGIIAELRKSTEDLPKSVDCRLWISAVRWAVSNPAHSCELTAG